MWRSLEDVNGPELKLFLKELSDHRRTPPEERKDPSDVYKVSDRIDSEQWRIKNEFDPNELYNIQDEIYQTRSFNFHWDLSSVTEMSSNHQYGLCETCLALVVVSNTKDLSASGNASPEGDVIRSFNSSKIFIWSSETVNSSLAVFFSYLFRSTAIDVQSLRNIRYAFQNPRNDQSSFLVLGGEICCTTSIVFGA